MPLRSPKMYRFIFGFHRLVWWPKCTPASRSSLIVITPIPSPPLLYRRDPPSSESRAGGFFRSLGHRYPVRQGGRPEIVDNTVETFETQHAPPGFSREMLPLTIGSRR